MTDFLATDIDALLINPTMTVDNSMEAFKRITLSSPLHLPDLEPTMHRASIASSSMSSAADDSDNWIDALQEPQLQKMFRELKNKRSASIFFHHTSNVPGMPFDHLPSGSEDNDEDLFELTLPARYSSEDEVPSPQTSSDTSSVHSRTDATASESPKLTPSSSHVSTKPDALALKPEQLASSCVKIEHRCNRAQAITLKTVGKPKVVSLSKSVDITTPRQAKDVQPKHSPSLSGSRRNMRPSLEAVVRVSRVEEEGDENISQADEVTTTQSPSRPTRRPSVPLLRAAAAFDPFPDLVDIAIDPDAPSRPRTLVKRAHTASASMPTTISPPDPNEQLPLLSYESPIKRRLHRLASSFSLGSASDLIRRKSSMPNLRKTIAVPPIPAEPMPRPSQASDQTGPRTPAGPIPKRHSSVGKLTPRGPTERAPIIVLPPCPDDDEDDDFVSVSPVEALQKWDRSRAKHVAKANKARPSIDDIVARMM